MEHWLGLHSGLLPIDVKGGTAVSAAVPPRLPTSQSSLITQPVDVANHRPGCSMRRGEQGGNPYPRNTKANVFPLPNLIERNRNTRALRLAGKTELRPLREQLAAPLELPVIRTAMTRNQRE